MQALPVALLCLGLVIGITALAGERRTLLPDDLMNTEEIGDVTISPDGQMVAYVRRRPRLSATEYGQPYLWGADRADIWVAPVSGGTPTNLTQGAVDGSGYFMPIWSHDSAYLAMLSTKGGDNVRLWVWEKATNRLTRMSDRGIAFVPNLPGDPPFAWIGNRRLVVALLAQGEKTPYISAGRRTVTAVMREWLKNCEGQQTTASILESGVETQLDGRPQQQLMLFDVTGKAQSLASAAAFINVRVASDGQYLAFLKEIALLRPDPRKLMNINDRLGLFLSRYQLVITDGSGRIVIPEAKGAKFIVPGSFQWSNDGRSFAFIGVRESEEDGPFRVFRGYVDGPVEAVLLPSGDPQTLAWASGDRLMVLAEAKVSRGVTKKRRLDWWLVSQGAPPRNLTQQLKTAPADLLPGPLRRTFVGVTDDDVWRVNIDSGEWSNLTIAFEPKVSSIAWPNASISRDIGFGHLVISVSRGQLNDYYRVDVASSAVTALDRSSDFARLIAYRPETDVRLFAAEEGTGTYLTLVQGAECRSLVEANTFLRNIAEGERRMIKYRSLDGQELKAWLILPPNYQSGKQYPLVTYVYAGHVMGDEPDRLTRFNLDSPLNLQLLAARGYAVLVPSMPLKPVPDDKDTLGSDPYMELTKGVLAAVDKAIEIGIADPKRLAVMGHSFGGYSTYGLVTQTNRFKAAIALAALSDLVSLYGVFDARFRYEPSPHQWLLVQSLLEAGQGSMGNPPWKDWDRYWRNSPLFYADRVQTPLLIVQGDLDFVSMEQGEEFFTALYRQDKRARFIRYWGEGHLLDSPANIRDFWTQAYAWLDEFCDISRDVNGNLVFDGDKVKSRNGASALKAVDFARFNEVELKSHPWIEKTGVRIRIESRKTVGTRQLAERQPRGLRPTHREVRGAPYIVDADAGMLPRRPICRSRRAWGRRRRSVD